MELLFGWSLHIFSEDEAEKEKNLNISVQQTRITALPSKKRKDGMGGNLIKPAAKVEGREKENLSDWRHTILGHATCSVLLDLHLFSYTSSFLSELAQPSRIFLTNTEMQVNKMQNKADFWHMWILSNLQSQVLWL